MEKSILFDSWHSWKVCFLSGCRKFGWGFARIVTCIILGVLSVIRVLWRALVGFVSRNPEFSVGAAMVIFVAVWLMTFMCMRTRAVGAECQRDSISWEYYQFKTSHGYE